MKKFLFCTLTSILSFLSSCGQTEPPTPATQVESLGQKTLLTTGGTYHFGNVEIEVPEGALSTPATIDVKHLPSPREEDVLLPEVNGTQSRFLMGKVPGKKVLAAYRITSNWQNVAAPITMILRNVGPKVEPESQMEYVYYRNNLTGEVNSASIQYGSREFFVPNIVPDPQTQGYDYTFFVYRAQRKDFEATCTQHKGYMEPGYCNLMDQALTVSPQAQENQQLAPQAISRTFDFLSWNVGNANAINETGCGLYVVKLCFVANEEAIANWIGNEITAGRKPSIIFFQELWHGRCKYVADSNTARVCGDPDRKNITAHQIKFVVGQYGVNYIYRCVPPRDTGTQVVDGYECIAVDPAVFDFSFGGTDIFAGTTALRSSCSADTGFQEAKFFHKTTGVVFTGLNAHLAAVTSSSCREAQLKLLQPRYGVPSTNKLLVAGDFNTEYTDTTGAGGEFNRLFQTGSPMLAPLISNPTENTAYFGGTWRKLDHVASNFFTGSCTRLAAFQSTDHLRTRCTLRATF